jgi:hypothetical protein
MIKENAIGKLQDKIKDEVLEATIGPMLEELCAAPRPQQHAVHQPSAEGGGGGGGVMGFMGF